LRALLTRNSTNALACRFSGHRDSYDYAGLLESPHGVRLPNGRIVPTKTVCRQAPFKKTQFNLASAQADLLASQLERVLMARRLLTASFDARTNALAEIAGLREQLRAQQTLVAKLDNTAELGSQPTSVQLPTKTELRRTLDRIVERMDEQLVVLEADLEFDAVQRAHAVDSFTPTAPPDDTTNRCGRYP